MDQQWKGRALGAILFDSKIVSQADIERALAEQQASGLRFGEALVKLGIVSDEDVHWGLSHQMNLPFVRLQAESIDPEAARLVPGDFARRHRLLPYLLVGDELTVIIEDPTNHAAVAELGELTGKRIIVGVGLPAEIDRALERIYGEGPATASSLEMRSKYFSKKQIKAIVADPSGRALLDALLELALKQRAAALHLECRRERLLARLRDRQRLTTVAELNRDWLPAIVRRLTKRLTQTEQRPHRLEGFLLQKTGARETPFHAAVVETAAGPAIILTNLCATHLADYLDALVTDEKSLPMLRALLAEPTGLLLLVGPEQPEKQQFLRALLQIKSTPEKQTVALGRLPQLFGLDLARVQPAGNRPKDLLAGLEGALALAPDLLVAEEATDPALLRALLSEALGARFIIASLRLPTLWSALEYLLDRGENRVLLCQSLRGLVCFSLIRVLPEEATEPDDRHELAARLLGVPPARVREGRLRRERGTAAGGAEGERQPLVSVLPLNAGLVAALKSDKPSAEIVETIRKTVGREMTAGLRESVLNGEITLDEYLSVVGSDNHASA